MFTFILFIIISLLFGFFATQNTGDVSISVASYKLSNIPLYIVLGVTLLIGLSLSWIISLLDSFSAAMKLRGKEHTIKDAKQSIHELTKKVNQLEIENAKLTGELKRESTDSNSFHS